MCRKSTETCLRTHVYEQEDLIAQNNVVKVTHLPLHINLLLCSLLNAHVLRQDLQTRDRDGCFYIYVRVCVCVLSVSNTLLRHILRVK